MGILVGAVLVSLLGGEILRVYSMKTMKDLLDDQIQWLAVSMSDTAPIQND